MADYAVPVDSIDNRYYRRAGITAVVYAVVDFLILVFGGPLVPLRMVGVLAAYFVVRDMMTLREAGVEWGWTRYVVLVLVAVGGFLGFILYAWRRYARLEDYSDQATQSTTEEGSEDPETASDASEEERA